MISPAEVAKLAYRLGVSDRVIEKDYVLSWLLIAIAESNLRNSLAFKGGTALKEAKGPAFYAEIGRKGGSRPRTGRLAEGETTPVPEVLEG